MASAFLASPSSRETTNFARLSRLLVDVGAQVLRKTFDHICPPATLHTHLSSVHPILISLRKKGILNPTQWGKLFPTISSSVTSQHFDITLLMVLLRNICKLNPPPTGWDNLPTSTDRSVEADIARIKYFRNVVYGHASHASVDDATFNNYWQDIREPLVRLGGADYGAAIDKLKTECMDSDMEAHYTELLKQWKKDEDNIKDKLEEIEEMIRKLLTAVSAALAQGFQKEEHVSPQAATASHYGAPSPGCEHQRSSATTVQPPGCGLPLFDDLQQLQQLKQMDHDFPLLNELKHKADEKGFFISHNPGAGNCMFFSLAEQLCLLKGITFYLQVGELRRKLVAFLQDNPKLANGTDLFNFVAGYPTWTDYLKDMEKDGTWGDHVILLAAANCFQVPIRVISSQHNQDDFLILPEAPVDDAQPLVLGHIQELHYVSLQSKQGAPSPHGCEHQRNPARPVPPPCSEAPSPGHKNQTTPARTMQPSDSEVRKLVTSMKVAYIKCDRFPPVPWCNTFENVYRRLTMKTRKMQSPVLTSQKVDVYDIFCSHENCTNPRSVLIEGNPGIGKTTFCQKLAKDWASEVIPAKRSFPKVELVLLLKCRDMDGDLRKEIEDQLLPLDVTDQEKCHFWEFLQDNQEKLLIILDGLDELSEQSRHDVDNLLLRRILPKCFLVVTARQERGIHVQKHFDTLLEIKGFTEDDAFLYIQRHFRGKEKESLATALIEKIRDNSYLPVLLQNPLNTVLLCLVFEDCEGTLPSTRTELYWSIVFCILKRFCTKQAVPFDDSTLIEQFEDVLAALGELALDGLKKATMCFNEKKLNSSTQQVPQMGFVFKEASTKVMMPEHNYSFPHKTFQEFFAALYVAHMVKRNVKDVYKFVSCIDDITGKFKQVLRFVPGILGEDRRRHFEMLGELITDSLEK